MNKQKASILLSVQDHLQRRHVTIDRKSYVLFHIKQTVIKLGFGDKAKVKTVEIDGFAFPVASDFDEFCEIAATNRACIMLINTKDYAQIMKKAFWYFHDKFGKDSDFTRASTGRLICSGCGVEFPSSYLFGLTDMSYGEVLGTTPDIREFGKTGKCPKCGSTQTLYVYDNPSAEEITQSDVDAIREYWRHLAQQWWKTQSETRAFCDGCNSPVPRDAGYLFGSNLYCENCCNTRDFALGPNALECLRKNPNYFGIGVLRKARHFVANK